MSISLGIGLKIGGNNSVGGMPLLPDLNIYIAGLGTPLSDAQLLLLNTLYGTILSGLSVATMYDFFDIAYLLGGETKESSYRNLVRNANHITVTSEPTWTIYKGNQGDGISQFLDTNYNPATQGHNYTLNNCTLGVLSLTDVGGTYSDIGSRTDTTNYTAIYSRLATDVAAMRLHTVVGVAINGAVTNSKAYFTVTRNVKEMTGLFGYRNKTSIARTTLITDTTSIPNGNFYIGARNLVGTGPEGFSPRQYAFAFASRYMTEAHRDVIIDAVEAYMDAHGEGVI